MSRKPEPAATQLSLSWIPGGSGTVLGLKLPEVRVAEKGLLVPSTQAEGGGRAPDGPAIAYRPWKLSSTRGRVRTVYHLAARLGLEDLNRPFIEALIAADLPEHLPDSPYKTLTVVDFSDALWGTRGLALARMEKNHHHFPYALFVADEKGSARKAWDLETGQSSVIVLDPEGHILFFKQGRLTPAEIRQAVGAIKAALGSMKA